MVLRWYAAVGGHHVSVARRRRDPLTATGTCKARMLFLVIAVALVTASASDVAAAACPASCSCRDVPSELDGTVLTAATCPNLAADLPATTNRLTVTSVPPHGLQLFLDDLHNVTQQLPQFSELSLSGCALTDIDDVSFVGLEDRLLLLDLSANLIAELPSASSVRVLANLTRLHTLDLSCNRIQYVDEQALGDLVSLKTLNLSANRINNVSAGGFIGLVQLEYLDLSSNNLSAVGGNVFSQLTQLQYLNLSNNKIEVLDGDCFSRLSRLQQLDVSRNQLTSVEPSALQALPSLARLTLAGNPRLGDLLVGTGRRLQAVDASRTGLAHVPPALTRSVRTLRLAGNAIHTVRCGDLDSYPLLQLLDFAANALDSLEDDALGRLDMLFMLYLSENKLRTVPRSLPVSLKTLHLERNNIEQLSVGHLTGLAQLEVLLLSDNDISVLEEGAFDELTSLVTLDLSGNPLSVLGGGALGGPARLQVLRLAGLPVATAARDTAFPVHAPERLVSLDLTASPGLARMLLADAAALSAARYLQELSLADAGLAHIRPDLLNFLPQLRSLRLAGNRLDCSGLLWLARWMRQQNREEDRAVMCATPPDLAGSLLVDLQEGDLPETTTTTTTTTIVTTATAPITTPVRYVPTELILLAINSTVEMPILNSTRATILADGVSPTRMTSDMLPVGSANGTVEGMTGDAVDNHQYMRTINQISSTVPSVAAILPTGTVQPQHNLYPIMSNLATNKTGTKSNITSSGRPMAGNSTEHAAKKLNDVGKETVRTPAVTAVNGSILSTKYVNRSYQQRTSAKILRDLFVASEQTTFNNKTPRNKEASDNNNPADELFPGAEKGVGRAVGGLVSGSLAAAAATVEDDAVMRSSASPTITSIGGNVVQTASSDAIHVLHTDGGTTTRLKGVSEPRFILSPVAAIKASHDAAMHVAEEDVTAATGEMSMYVAGDGGLAHPGMLVLLAGVLGAAAALVLAATRWGRRRGGPRRPAAQHQQDIEVNHLPGVTDLW